MSFTAEGTIEIDLEDFAQWVYENYLPSKRVEFKLGPARVNKSNQTLEVDFAMATDCHPNQWAVAPKVMQQWKELE